MSKTPPSKYRLRALRASAVRKAALKTRNAEIKEQFEAQMEDLPGRYFARAEIVCHRLSEKFYLTPGRIYFIATGRKNDFRDRTNNQE